MAKFILQILLSLIPFTVASTYIYLTSLCNNIASVSLILNILNNSYIWIDLVEFNGISSPEDYLMPNLIDIMIFECIVCW